MRQNHIGKLLPIEGFSVVFKGEVSTTLFQTLTHLYQPLVGVNAIALYLTLLSEYEMKNNESPQTHHTLMNYLSLPLDEIYEARLKLEAIGLLETYQTDTEKELIYLYKLNSPFSSKEFFNDGMLSQLLYHHLGEEKYENIHNTLTSMYDKPVSGQNITANFNDVFNAHSGKFSVKQNTHKNSDTVENHGPKLESGTIDFEWMGQMLSQRMLPVSKILATPNKKLMEQMIALYDLTNQDIEKALLWAINDENELDQSEFKSACLDLFQAGQKNPNSNIVDRKAPSGKKQAQTPDKQLNKQEQFIQMLEQISPRQLLEDLSGGNAASTQDLKVISDVMSQQGLSPGVMNVLIHYVLLKTDMKLTKAYLEKIASHWARKNVTTVRQAMALAKSETNKYQQWGNNKTTNYYKKPGKKEVIPDWFKERKEGKGTSSNNQQQQEKKEDIGELLKNYKSNKSSQ